MASPRAWSTTPSGCGSSSISPDLLDTESDVPWKAIARMRDHVTHRYFDTDHSVVGDVVDNELGPLLRAVRSLATGLADGS